MRDLFRMERDDEQNAQRNFWQWVSRQPWRRMLPEPIECFNMQYCLGFGVCGVHQWYIDVHDCNRCLGYQLCLKTHPTRRSIICLPGRCSYRVMCLMASQIRCQLVHVHIHSMLMIASCKLQVRLDLPLRWEPLSPKICGEWRRGCLHNSVRVNLLKHIIVQTILAEAILAFWNHMRPTKFFQEHPVLNNPATCQQT